MTIKPCYSLLPLSVSPEQQSAHAKEATEDMEVAILKTCQSVSDLRREVSNSLSLLFPLSLNRCTQLQKQTDMAWMYQTCCSATVAGFSLFTQLFSSPAVAVSLSTQLCHCDIFSLFFFLRLLKIPSHSYL